MRLAALFTLSLLLSPSLPAQERTVAITFDDIPRGGDDPSAMDPATIQRMTAQLVAHFDNIPATAFVNPGTSGSPALGAAGLQSILRQWLDRGLTLGNHTHTHPDAHRVPVETYTADIAAAEPALIQAAGRRPVYFRHPYLRAGLTLDTRRRIESFLLGRGYTVAPVTVGAEDYLFATVYADAKKNDPALARRVADGYLEFTDATFAHIEQRTREVFGREIPQILLLHANQLNADVMPALFALMKRRGYRIVSLDEAMRDPAYQSRDEYAGAAGLSWIHRWSFTKGMGISWEPDAPEWLRREWRRVRAVK